MEPTRRRRASGRSKVLTTMVTSRSSAVVMVLRRTLTLLGRPLEQGSHRAAQVAGVRPTGRGAFAGVLDVEGDDGVRGRSRSELLGADHDERRVDREQPLVEEVAWNPGGRDVVAGRERLLPAGARVQRVEDRVALLVEHLDLRHRLLARGTDVEGELDPDWPPDVEMIGRLPVLVDDAHRAQARGPVARRRLEVGPHALGVDAL